MSKNEMVANYQQSAQNDALEQPTALSANNPENQYQERENGYPTKKTARQSCTEKAQKKVREAEIALQKAKEQQKLDNDKLQNYQNLTAGFVDTLKLGSCRIFKKGSNDIIPATLSANYAVQSALNKAAELQPQRPASLVYCCPINQADRIIKIDEIELIELIFTNKAHQENCGTFELAKQKLNSFRLPTSYTY
jgi:hypothetical protein